MDIDANITGMDFGQDEITKMIIEIMMIDLDDSVSFEFNAIESIKEDSKYGGYSVRLTTKFFNVRIPLHLDISTGDIITPSAVDYRYKTVFDEGTIDLFSYNMRPLLRKSFRLYSKGTF